MLEIAYCNDQMTLALLVIHCPKQAVDGRKSIGGGCQMFCFEPTKCLKLFAKKYFKYLRRIVH